MSSHSPLLRPEQVPQNEKKMLKLSPLSPMVINAGLGHGQKYANLTLARICLAFT